jgi:excisionase family DNA binding protein
MMEKQRSQLSSETLLRIDEAADRLALKTATLRSRILKRQIPYVRIGRSVRIKSSVVDNLIASGEIPVRRSA